MQTVRAIDLARDLGIPRRTMSRLCSRRPDLAVMRDGEWFVRVDALGNCDGIGGTIGALLLARDPHRWVRIGEIAARFGVHRRTLARWARAGEIPARRIGRNWYVDTAEIEGLAAMLGAI